MKKIYSAPSAELIVLLPQEEIASWFWGTYDTSAASRSTVEKPWDPYNSGDDAFYDSIKYDN